MLRSLFVDLIGSFYSAPLYVRRLRDDRGIGFGWLAFVCLLSSLPTVVKVHYGALTEGAALSEDFIEQMPVLIFDDGKLFTEPMERKAIELGGVEIVIVDAALEGLTDDVGPGQFVLTHDYLVSRNNRSGQIRAQSYEWVGTRTVVHDDLRRWWGWWEIGGWAFLLLIMFGVYYIGMALFTLLLALPALTMGHWARVEAGYSTALRVTALAATPAIMLDGLSDAIGQPVPYALVIRIGLTLAFLLFAFNAAGKAPAELSA